MLQKANHCNLVNYLDQALYLVGVVWRMAIGCNLVMN